MLKKEIFLFLLSTFFVLLLLVLLQKYIMISPDVSYLLYAANQMLEGGHYVTEIFETNPPMILYLYFPACLLAKIVFINPMVAVRIYVFCLIVISMGVSFVLLKRVVGSVDKGYFITMFFAMLFVVFMLPMVSFGQREHLLLIFMLPYLLAAALRLDDKILYPWLAVVIGLFAGLGFAIKPYFLLALCMVELLFVWKKNRLFAWVRIETVVIASVLVLYLCSIIIFQPGYIKSILPLVSKYYFSSIKQPWLSILSQHYVMFCFIIAMLYLYFIQDDEYKNLGNVIFVALIGMMLAFSIPQNAWYYHVFPALGLAFLLMMHCFGQQLVRFKKRSKKSVFITCFIVVIAIFFVREYYGMLRQNIELTKNNPANTVVELFNKLSGKHTISCFSLYGTPSCFPMVYEINGGQYQSRFPSFWWYSGLRFAEIKAKNNDELRVVTKDREYLIEAIADDLDRYKATWILIDARNSEHIKNLSSDLIASFIINDRFKHAWQHYAYYTTVLTYDIYLRKS